MSTNNVVRMGPPELRRLPVHHHAGLFRPLAGDERDGLRESMQRGYDPLYAIVVWSETGEIVDGRNRRDLACQLELENVPVLKREFAYEAEVSTYIASVNLARRHLDARGRRELAGRLVVNGASTRDAAKVAGVSPATAQREASKVRASGVSRETPARTTGADGRSYPATKQPTAGRVAISRSSAEPTRKPDRRKLLDYGVGSNVYKTSEALEKFIRRDLRSEPLPAKAREQAASYADTCRAMAATFEALANGETVDGLVRPYQPARKRSRRDGSTKATSTIGGTPAA